MLQQAEELGEQTVSKTQAEAELGTVLPNDWSQGRGAKKLLPLTQMLSHDSHFLLTSSRVDAKEEAYGQTA